MSEKTKIDSSGRIIHIWCDSTRKDPTGASPAHATVWDNDGNVGRGVGGTPEEAIKEATIEYYKSRAEREKK